MIVALQPTLDPVNVKVRVLKFRVVHDALVQRDGGAQRTNLEFIQRLAHARNRGGARWSMHNQLANH